MDLHLRAAHHISGDLLVHLRAAHHISGDLLLHLRAAHHITSRGTCSCLVLSLPRDATTPTWLKVYL